MNDRPLLRLRGASRTFGGQTSTTALRSIDLDVAEGEFVAITGPSGAGKSTLLNIIGLLDSMSSGFFEIDGHDTAQFSERVRDSFRMTTFGFVFQASHVLPFETVAFNAALGLSIQGAARARRVPRVTEALKQVGLLHRSENLARTLSGGERQRLAIARAMAGTPRIILADEPTGNLDSDNTLAIMKLLLELNATGVTVVVITHDADVARFADRIVEVRDGTLSDVGAPVHARPKRGADLKPAARVQRGFLTRLQGSFERLADALSSLTSRPARTLALVCAFLLGTGALVAATGLGSSASQQVSDRLSAGALDEVYVHNPAGTTAEVRTERINAVEELDHVVAVGEHMEIPATDALVSRFAPQTATRSDSFSGSAMGADSTFLDLQDAIVRPSNAAGLLDRDDSGNVALIGSRAAEELGISQTGQSVEIWLRGRPFTIVGFVTDGGRKSSLTSSVIVPTHSLPDSPSTLMVRTDLGYPAVLAESIPLQLAPGNPASISVATVGDLRNLRTGVAGDLGALVGAISGLLLTMAVLSAGTAMYLSVQSRTQELALRRALGLSRAGTMSIFLLEGTIVGLAGGLAGTSIGMVSIVVTSAALGWTAVLPPGAIIAGLVAGVIGGALSAALPAQKASQIEPAQAIR